MNGESRPAISGTASTTPAKKSNTVYVPVADNGRLATLETLAKLLRDEGIVRANEAADPWWASCFDTAVAYLASTGIPFTADDCRDLVPPPRHPNQVGARFNAAAKAGVIRQAGYALSRSRSRHAGVLRRWVGCDAA